MKQYLIAHIGHTLNSHHHVCWWKPDSRGYTICVDKAGRYSAEEAASICRHPSCVAIEVEQVEPMAMSTPYYRVGDGRLAKLYDGDSHRPVPNTRECWGKLLALRAFPGADVRTDKPTPISAARSRVIYLDAASA